MLKFSEIFEFSKEKFRKIPILKEFEWFEWFEWFGPSPIEPFNSGFSRQRALERRPGRTGPRTSSRARPPCPGEFACSGRTTSAPIPPRFPVLHPPSLHSLIQSLFSCGVPLPRRRFKPGQFDKLSSWASSTASNRPVVAEYDPDGLWLWSQWGE